MNQQTSEDQRDTGGAGGLKEQYRGADLTQLNFHYIHVQVASLCVRMHADTRDDERTCRKTHWPYRKWLLRWHFRVRAICARAIAGDVHPSRVRTEADRLRHVHEQIVYLQGQINNRMYDATQAMHRLQMTWQQLAEWWLPPRKHHLRWKIPGDEPPQALPQDSQDYRIYAASLVLYISYTCL